jgi:hypothetical protein
MDKNPYDSSIRLVKGDLLIRLTFERDKNKEFQVRIYSFKAQKPLRYTMTGQLIPVSYRYLLYDHRNDYYRSKLLQLKDEQEININDMIDHFTEN